MASPVGRREAIAVGELAKSQGIRECLQWFTREKQWISEQHLQLCRIPAPTFLEQKRAEWMAEQFRSVGCAVEIDRAGNVIARTDPTHPGPFVAVTAHLDTVLAPRAKEDIAFGPDGKLHGPGASDNGAGLAALLALARAIRLAPFVESCHASLLLIANVGEEGEGNLSGMRFLCCQSPLAERIEAFLVLDGPGTDHITCQALASRRFEVSFTGPGGHSWSDYGIGNPVHALCRAIAVYSENNVNNGATAPRSSYNFGIIEGGSSVNSIPAVARAKVDIRSDSDQKMEELSSLLATAVERALEVENDRATGGKLTAKIKEIGFRPAGRLSEDATILRFLRSVDSHLGIRSTLDCASTDANIPLSMGMSAICIGAGGQGGGAHTAAEWFHPDGRDLALKRILLTLAFLMQN